MLLVICSLCGVRKTRRACPALGHDICAKCCGTKRLTEIACPSDCPHLAAAREHPAAAVVRQRQLDVGVLLPFVSDFTAEQSEIFVHLGSYVARYKGSGLETLLDEDLAGAATALA